MQQTIIKILDEFFKINLEEFKKENKGLFVVIDNPYQK